MPIGKDIHRVISKKWKSRAEKTKAQSKPPVVIKQSEKNITSVARPEKVNKKVTPRKISKTEGTPTVNGKSGEEVAKRNVHKPKTRAPRVKAGDAAIKPKAISDDSSASSRKRGRPRKKTPPKSSGPSTQ
jgi:hypothetical protein